jgi:hypothetical protein
MKCKYDYDGQCNLTGKACPGWCEHAVVDNYKGDDVEKEREIIPIRDFVLMVAKKYVGRILVPETTKETVDAEWHIIAIGPEVKWLKAGDRVIPEPNTVIGFKANGKIYYATREFYCGMALREKSE